jgi:hypothetical protein
MIPTHSSATRYLLYKPAENKKEIELMQMRTKYIVATLLLCSQLLLSCGYQPKENIPQPKPDIPIYPYDSGTL